MACGWNGLLIYQIAASAKLLYTVLSLLLGKLVSEETHEIAFFRLEFKAEYKSINTSELRMSNARAKLRDVHLATRRPQSIQIMMS